MSKQTRNRNLMNKSGKKQKKTDGNVRGTTAPWNPADSGDNRRKSDPKRPLGRSMGKSRGIKTHGGSPNRRDFGSEAAKENWIWGHHAVKAALENPRRTHHKLLVSKTMYERLGDSIKGFPKEFKGELIKVHPSEIDDLLPDGAAHQGAALKSAPLPDHDLDAIASPAKGLIIVLDQITDPHNVGAIFRLAAAFDAKAVVLQTRGAPPLAGAVTKVAVGTVETVPHVLVTNIANSLLELQKMGWRVTGLAGEANITLQQAFQRAEAEVIVMGAEGPGLRKRVRDCCDQLAKIPMPGEAESLNVSTAAGIALYEATRNIGRDMR
ncbi:MAG: 23S rRNA (guanosine(2251)-2'-O)-methyltransferase RlmB [Robiginitomaculum sp.]|nr:MAG: 23S rRNA (guanosine(2251)-2'-O)-methyltransferase RlmB [Robiginitomaculum sp.]